MLDPPDQVVCLAPVFQKVLEEAAPGPRESARTATESKPAQRGEASVSQADQVNQADLADLADHPPEGLVTVSTPALVEGAVRWSGGDPSDPDRFKEVASRLASVDPALAPRGNVKIATKQWIVDCKLFTNKTWF